MENAAMRILTRLLVLTLSMGAMSQLAPGHYQAGRYYEVLEKPDATSHPDKLGSVEIFSYLCGHRTLLAPLRLIYYRGVAGEVVARAPRRRRGACTCPCRLSARYGTLRKGPAYRQRAGNI